MEAEIKRLYEEERMLEIYEILSAKKDSLDSPWLKRVHRDASEAASMFELLRVKGEEWHVSVDSDGIAVRYRPEMTSRFASVCVSVNMIEASASVVMTTMNEVGLLGSFLPKFLGFEACTLKQVSRFRQLVWMRVRLPFPFAPRDVVFDAMGVDCLHAASGIMVLVRDAKQEDWPDVELLPPPDKRNVFTVRAKVLLAGALIVPLTPTRASLINLMNVDPVLPVLPGWLMNWLNRKCVWYAFDSFRKQVAGLHQKLPPAYQEQVAAKPYIYEELANRLAPWEKKLAEASELESTGGHLSAEEQ